MSTKILNSARAPFYSKRSAFNHGFRAKLFSRNAAEPALAAPTLSALPLGSLWDPTLLARLRVPLTRHRE